MSKRNNKHERRVRKLILFTFLCAVLFGVSTYAWFIGMKTVNVNSFDVTIAGIDGLSLSLDGKTFSDSVSINSGNYNDTSVVYTGNTNSWGGSGLIPMSSVGIIDADVSRLIMYEKGSFTTTPGGYRVMASRVNNYNKTEGVLEGEADGYVVFDLFIKNLSGNEYYDTLNKLNEEAIYLTLGSKVEVGDAGAPKTGIENSVRVGFAQIGRVKATVADEEGGQAKITGITCTSNSTTGVTGICADRVAQIWEPNDAQHEPNALNWYNTSCKKRVGANVTETASYDGNCKTLSATAAYPTYAISGVVNYTDNVDVYDGAAYNEYTGSVAAYSPESTTIEKKIAEIPTLAANGKLIEYPYFTDTMKNLQGVQRPTFMTLAPNSITKVRVYIWIEGQDVDNYDFASLGKQIKVAFGFTKERFYGEDIHYDNNGTANLPENVIRGD